MVLNYYSEKDLVLRAKAGVKAARNKLFTAILDEIEKTHTYSAKGFFPKAFAYSYNKNGVSFKEYQGELFEVFLEALKKFNYDIVSTPAELPFLRFLKVYILFRAHDAVRKESKRKKRMQMVNPKDYSNNELHVYAGNDDEGLENLLARHEQLTGGDYYGYYAESRQAEMERCCDELKGIFADDPLHLQMIDEFLKISNAQKLNVESTMAKEIYGDESKRTSVIHHLGKSMILKIRKSHHVKTNPATEAKIIELLRSAA